MELSGVSAFIALFLLNVQDLQAAKPLHLLLTAGAAWITADLLSGLVHWAFDSFGSVRTPLVGPAFIRPFREHHVDPQAMTRHDFVETNGSSCLAATPLLLWALLFPNESSLMKPFLVWLSLGLLAANQCHKWAHAESRPGPISFLQRNGMILDPAEHRLHHAAPFDRRYCTASGWLNRPLDAVLSRLRGG